MSDKPSKDRVEFLTTLVLEHLKECMTKVCETFDSDVKVTLLLRTDDIEEIGVLTTETDLRLVIEKLQDIVDNHSDEMEEIR